MSAAKRKRDTAPKHHELTLEQKLEVLHDMNAKFSYRKLAEKYNVSLGSLTKISKNRDKIENEAADSANLQLKRPRRAARYDDVNKCVLEFLRRARPENLPMTGPLLQEKGNFYAESLGETNFAASNGWLQPFLTRNNISSQQLSGESGDNNVQAGEQWMTRLSNILHDFQLHNIFNANVHRRR